MLKISSTATNRDPVAPTGELQKKDIQKIISHPPLIEIPGTKRDIIHRKETITTAKVLAEEMIVNVRNKLIKKDENERATKIRQDGTVKKRSMTASPHMRSIGEPMGKENTTMKIIVKNGIGVSDTHAKSVQEVHISARNTTESHHIPSNGR